MLKNVFCQFVLPGSSDTRHHLLGPHASALPHPRPHRQHDLQPQHAGVNFTNINFINSFCVSRFTLILLVHGIDLTP